MYILQHHTRSLTIEKAGRGGTHLEFQHSEVEAGMSLGPIVSSRTACWTTERDPVFKIRMKRKKDKKKKKKRFKSTLTTLVSTMCGELTISVLHSLVLWTSHKDPKTHLLSKLFAARYWARYGYIYTTPRHLHFISLSFRIYYLPFHFSTVHFP